MKRKSVLINPIVSRSLDDAHRSATPLELFYDLIYVVAIAFLAAELHHALSSWHHVEQAVLLYLFIFWCIWWPWNTYTWFSSGFDTDDAQFRLASFAQMIGVIIIAVSVKYAFADNNFLIMMIGYIVMRIPYIVMWLKAAHDDVTSRSIALRYAMGALLMQLSWIIAILYFQNWYLFICLVIGEMMVPYFAEIAADKGKNTKYHFEHIEERMGLLTLIVLGESVLASVHAFDELIAHFSFDMAMLVAGSLMILFSMWWLYFDDKVGEKLADEKSSFIWGYGHYFVFASVTAVGALISVNVDAMTNHGSITQHAAIIGLAISIAIYLVSVWFCHDNFLNRSGVKRIELLILAAVVIVISILMQSILLIGFAFVTLNIIRLFRKHREFENFSTMSDK